MSTTNGIAPPELRYHEEIGDVQRKLSLRSIPELTRGLSRAELAPVSLLDALDSDGRPSFIVNLSSDQLYDDPLDLVYLNPALSAAPQLVAMIAGKESPGTLFVNAQEPHRAFKNWLWGMMGEVDLARRGNAYIFGDHLWWATTVEHYSVVSGTPIGLFVPVSTHNKSQLKPTSPTQRMLKRGSPMPTDSFPAMKRILKQTPPSNNLGPLDYTLDPPPEVMSDHVKYFRSIDWVETPLGPMHSWPLQLRCIVNMMMNDCCPAVLFWGNSLTMIYNEDYIELISLLHPCMGRSARDAANNYWPLFQPTIDHINATGETVSKLDMPVFLVRQDFVEETFFSFQFIPILNSAGRIAGYYQRLLETTKNKLLERRVSSLVEVGSQTAKARDLSTYWELLLDTLAINDKDAPFALLYAAELQSASGISSISSPGSNYEPENYVLKGTIGVETGHAIAPLTINVKGSSSIFHPHLVQAIKSKKPVAINLDELDTPDGIFEGINWQGHGDPCRSVVVCPILPTTGEHVQGFLILGVNPRRPFDDEYKQFVQVMLRLLATSLASVVLFDEEMRQKENAIGQAARIQEQLTAELQLKENKFQRYADRSDVAIFVMDPVGNYTYRNKSWYDIFEVAANENYVGSVWTNVVWPEDVPVAEALFSKLVDDKTPVLFELKTSMPWKPPTEDLIEKGEAPKHYKWILCSAYPELDTNNEIVEIVGNVTDISKQKWAEGTQKLRMDSALESKHHLEHFIDTTSHEMRNPLSAIMQCADGILSAYPEADGKFPGPCPKSYASILDQTLDAAQTIAQCAQHMKRIVDDILTISKLDSGLLVITPIDAQPKYVASHAVKMFEGEAKAADIDMRLIVDQSFQDLNVDWVSLDPTRLLQVLINLITNALKFTRLESTRKITVTIAASEEQPDEVLGGTQFEEKLVNDDSNLVEDWKRGPVLYLKFSVTDTGLGLTDEERSSLFARFSQASPRTHIHYGGSGLGLFISRRLTEMQGGAIGLSSIYNQGSTFSFYIKARQTPKKCARRPSPVYAYPEDIRHRATTHKEIDQMRKRPQHLARAHMSCEDISTRKKYHPPLERCSSERQYPVRPPNGAQPSTFRRRQSALHSHIPAEAIGLPPDPDLIELKRSRSIPQTLHVLVVEDNLVNQKVLAKQLQNLGCVVSVANHGAEALDFLKKTSHWNCNHPAMDYLTYTPSQHVPTPEYVSPKIIYNDVPIDLSIILMDWEMPIMNGLTAVAKIRELEQEGILKERIPVIGVTANVREQQIQTAMDAGMDDVVSKPFRVAELMGRMRGIIRGVLDGSGNVHRAVV